MARQTNAVLQERLYDIACLLAEGTSNKEVVDKVAEKYNISIRQAQKYVKRATEDRKQYFKQHKDDLYVADMLWLRKRRNLAGKDRDQLAYQQEIAKMLNYYPKDDEQEKDTNIQLHVNEEYLPNGKCQSKSVSESNTTS